LFIFIADFGDGVRGMFGLVLRGRVFAPARFLVEAGGFVIGMNVDGFGDFRRAS